MIRLYQENSFDLDTITQILEIKKTGSKGDHALDAFLEIAEMGAEGLRLLFEHLRTTPELSNLTLDLKNPDLLQDLLKELTNYYLQAPHPPPS